MVVVAYHLSNSFILEDRRRRDTSRTLEEMTNLLKEIVTPRKTWLHPSMFLFFNFFSIGLLTVLRVDRASVCPSCTKLCQEKIRVFLLQ